MGRWSHCRRGVRQAYLLAHSAHIQHMAFELRQFIQEAHAVVRPRHVPGHWHLAAAEQPDIRDSVMGARKGRVVTRAVRSPVRTRTATRWMRVVSMALGRVIAGRMVVSRRASINLPAPGGPAGGYGHNARMAFPVASASREK
jgi:hypothetical protein